MPRLEASEGGVPERICRISVLAVEGWRRMWIAGGDVSDVERSDKARVVMRGVHKLSYSGRRASRTLVAIWGDLPHRMIRKRGLAILLIVCR